MDDAERTEQDSVEASIHRGVRLLAGLGAMVGGIGGTVAIPVLGTIFGALLLGILGAVVGWVDGVLLWAVRRRTRSPWAARAASGSLAVAVAVPTGAYLAAAGNGAQWAAVVIVLGALSVAYATALGPLIAAGEEPRSDRGVAARPMRLVSEIVQLGMAAGAVAGTAFGIVVAVVAGPSAGGGLVVVAVTALLGLVVCGLLACAVAGLVVMPRVRARL